MSPSEDSPILAERPISGLVSGEPGTFPTASRYTLPTGRENNVDLTAIKRFSVSERYKLEIQAQAFNVLNHSQYLPGSLNDVGSNSSTGTGAGNFVTVSSPQFNQKQLDFSNNARTMQLSGKIIF